VNDLDRYVVMAEQITVASYDGFAWRYVSVDVPVIRRRGFTTFTVAPTYDADLSVKPDPQQKEPR
jgi:hypothetical protein